MLRLLRPSATDEKGSLVPSLKRSRPLAWLIAAAIGSLAAPYPAPAGADLFTPALRADFPDPFIIEHQGRYLAYATNTNKGRENVPMAASPDLLTWEMVKDRQGGVHDAMPNLPPWAKKGNTWAPEVLKTDGGFVLYFTARHKKNGLQCVGTAVSADPLGPFTSQAAEPLVCQLDLGGTIDASPFRDADGQLYLYFKNDGNNPKASKPTQIWVQRLTPDGLGLTGDPVALLKNDAPWEAHVIEAPTMVRHDGAYTMFYSANDYGWQDTMRLSPYAIGYANCKGPLGPCTDSPNNPFLNSFNDPKLGCLSGPGHQTVIQAAGRSYIAFHAWQASSGCRRVDWERHMYVAPLLWKNGEPAIGSVLRPAPATAR
jgi:beta-xylosidase